MFNYNLGGYKRQTKTRGDCVPRAISIATDLPYQEVYDELQRLQEELRLKSRSKYYYHKDPRKNKPRSGTSSKVYKPYLEKLGWTWIPTMGIGTGCRVHLKPEELPKGRIICRLSRHLVAVIDGVMNDTYDSSRDGTRCVYGYFIKKENK
jgi:hypothetical protein|tara:strand:+ start:2115 stop:2564 length:450 start_codon:yes stop_codon:yes gene_type:complete